MALSLLLPLSRPPISYVKRLQGLAITKHWEKAVYFREKSYQTLQATQDDLFHHIHPRQLASKEKYPLAGVEYLPGSHSKGIPKFLADPRQGLPQAFKVKNADTFSISEWAKHCRTLLDKELPQFGAVLFRGLPLTKGEHFSLFTSALGYTPMGYEGGAVDRPVVDKSAYIFQTTSEDNRFNIEPHSDLAYWTVYPHKIIFYCDKSPAEGCRGLTPITRSREILENLDPEVVQKFEEKQIRYMRTLPNGKGYLPWQNTFSTSDHKKVENHLEDCGFSYKWYTDGSLFYFRNLPATILHPLSGEKVWFNQAESHHSSYFKSSPVIKGMSFESDSQFPYHTTYGDGTEIERHVLQHMREISWQCTVGFPWRNGDMLCLDNIKLRHARLSYTGDRRVLVYMSSD